MLPGKLVTLRAPLDKDLPALTALRNHVAIQKQLMAQPRGNSPQRVAEWISRLSSDPASMLLVIADRKGDGAAGYLQLKQIDPLHGTAELGICLAEEFQGKGFAREAMRLLEAHAAATFRLRKLVLRVLAANAPAIRLYEKSGWRAVGTLQSHFFQDGEYRDVLVMERFLAEGGSPAA